MQRLNTTQPMRLIVVAACDVESVSFPDVDGIGIETTYRKADLKLGLAMLDWLAVTIFMMSIWLESSGVTLCPQIPFRTHWALKPPI